MASSNQSPQALFSVRPLQPLNDRRPKNLSEFISRVNAQAGGFRNVRQDELQKQVEEKRQKLHHDGNDDDVHMYDGTADEEDEQADSDSETKDLTAARNNMLRNIEIAYFNAKQTLDVVSLWMSKERPTQVMGTLDGQLRQLVGIGTIGSTKLHERYDRKKKEEEGLLIATGSKLLSINKSADTLLAAASRLQKESSVESKYWKDVLEVKERGWPVARLPHGPHTLAVKFGFSETSIPEFQHNSWAAMRRAHDGSVHLDAGRLASEAKRVVVSLEKDGRVFGRSSLAPPTSDDAPIEEHVREARNTILALELWHEINREARTLLAYNVVLQADSVVYTIDQHTLLKITLVTLGEDTEESTVPEQRNGDAYADTICLGLYLLLAYSHRQAARRRSQLMPVSTTDQANTTKAPYHLIKPVISYLQHELWLRSTIQFVSNLCGLLQTAGIKTARYTLQEHNFPPSAKEGASEQLLTLLLTRMGFRIELTIAPQARFDIIGVGHVVMSQATSGFLRIGLLPPLNQPAPHPLQNLFQPAEQYPTTHDAFHYLRKATCRVLAKHFEHLAAEWTSNNKWLTDIKGDALRDRETESAGVRFLLLSDYDERSDKSALGPPVTELRVETARVEGEGLKEGLVVWKLNGENKGTLGGTVHHVLMGTESVEVSDKALES